jgi:hypothetical protein
MQNLIESRVRHFVYQSGIDFNRLGNALGETAKFVFRWWNRPHEQRLSSRHLANLSAYLGLSIEQLLDSNLAIEQLRQLFIDGPSNINERYFKDAYSNVRTTAHIVRYLSIRFGRARVDALLREMGVHPCIYASHDNKINIDFFLDLLEQARRIGLRDEEIHQLGCYMFLGVANTPLGQQFAAADNYIDSYQVLNRNFDNFDQNFIYKVELFDDGFEMRIEPGDVLAKKIYDGQSDCSTLALYRKYMMCWFPYLSGLSPLSGHLIKSMAYGDPHCVLRAYFPPMSDRPNRDLRPPLVQGV